MTTRTSEAKLRIAKDDLVARLNEKLTEATKFDEEQYKLHREANKGLAQRRREYLRNLAKMPSDDLAELDAWTYRKDFPGSSTCPLSKVNEITQALQWLGSDTRKHLMVSRDDMYGRILKWSATPTLATVC